MQDKWMFNYMVIAWQNGGYEIIVKILTYADSGKRVQKVRWRLRSNLY